MGLYQNIKNYRPPNQQEKSDRKVMLRYPKEPWMVEHVYKKLIEKCKGNLL